MTKKKNVKQKKVEKYKDTKPKDNKVKKKRKFNFRKLIKVLLILFFIGCIMALVAVGLFLGYIVKNAPTFEPKELYDAKPSIIYDKDGIERARLGNKIRTVVSYDQLPESLVDAIVATEDSRFFQHNGFDLPRFLVASVKQALGNSEAGGASTLTMQLSKNKITVKDGEKKGGFQGIIRKFTDIYMAVFKIERTYTKEEIIEFYVNSNYLGADTNGVEDASQVYFGKSVSELSIAESAMIAGIFNAPGMFDPYLHPEACEQRRTTVLYLLKRHGYITDEEYEIAKQMTVDKIVKPRVKKSDNVYQDFIDMVTDEVIEKTGLNPYDVAMNIYTTMDSGKQEYMYNLLAGNVSYYKWADDTVQAGIAVVSATDGSVVAIGGGRNRVVRGINRATGIKRQIGSTAKPLYEYGLGIEKLNWSTGQIFVDEPWGYTNGVNIKNWDKTYKGFVDMRMALVESRNIPALKAFQQISNQDRIEWINSLGLHPELEGGFIHEAHAIGGYNGEYPLSMAAAYNAFASGGYYYEPYSITKVEFLDGSEPYVYKPVVNKVMSPETAWLMTNVLISVAQGTGFSNYYVNGVTYAGKSGTTNLSDETLKAKNLPSKAVADLWAVGYTDKYTIATWYGYDDLDAGYNIFGSGQNYRIFTAVARGIFTEKSNFTRPAGVVAVEVERGWGDSVLSSEFTPDNLRALEYFKKGYEPTVTSNRFTKLSNVSSLKADVKDSKVELSWTPITTPQAIDLDYQKAYYASKYKDAGSGEAAALAKYNENLSLLGTIVYKVYEQTEDGLKLIKTTDETKITLEPTVENPTYVVKTSYTVFEKNISDGTTIKVTGVKVKDLVTATQKITKATVKPTDTKLTDEKKIAIVSVNGIDVDTSKVSYQYKLDNTKVDGDTYKIAVKVIYNKVVVDTFNIDITVKESTE